MNASKYICGFLATLLFIALNVSAEPLLGRAVIASMRGDIYYEWEDGSEPVTEGMALTDGHRIVAGNGAALCSVLTPGAILCVRENTVVDLKNLTHATDGLPEAGKATQKMISLNLVRGVIMLHADESATDRSIEVSIGLNLSLFLSDGEVIVAAERTVRKIYIKEGMASVKSDGVVDKLESGAHLVFELQQSGGEAKWVKSLKSYSVPGVSYDFSICRKFFPALNPLALNWSPGNMSKLNEWIEPSPGIKFVSKAREWDDVSPSVRNPVLSKHSSGDQIAPASPDNGQWRRPDVWSWYRGMGSLRGVNYLPRTAVNSIDMWQEDSFDPKTIDQELEWAHKAGLGSVRVFLPFAVWDDGAKGLKERMDKFLSLASKYDLSTVFVLFDDKQMLAESRVGAQPEPLPGVHNSRWVASPDHALVAESAGKWPVLKEYVEDVVKSFANDERVLMWDLYNQAGSSGMGVDSMPLLTASFEWVRKIKPKQPVTAGISYDQTREARQEIMKKADVITLADYGSAEKMSEVLTLVSSRGRPVICTGWLDREQRNTFKEILPIFSKYEVGWYLWGLVQGKTQLYVSKNRGKSESVPEVWDQDLLTPEGKPFDKNEIKLIKEFSFE